jgi:hypothetical protein
MALTVKTGVDGSGFAAGLERMSQDASNFGKNLSARISGNFSQAIMGVVPGLTSAIAAVFSADKIKEALHEFSEKVEHIELGAAQLNIQEGQFQQIDRVMKEVGGSAQDVRGAFEKIAEAMTKIEEQSPGWEKLRTQMGQLGLSGDDLKKTYQEVFMRITEGMKGVSLSQEQIAAGRAVMGRGFDQIMPALAIGGFESDFAKSGQISGRNMATVKAYKEDMRDMRAEYAGAGNDFAAASMGLLDQVLHGGGIGAEAVAKHRAEILARIHKEKEEGEARKKKTDETAEAAKQAAALDVIHKTQAKRHEEDQKKAAGIDLETIALQEKERLAQMDHQEKITELKRQNTLLAASDDGSLSLAEKAAVKKRTTLNNIEMLRERKLYDAENDRLRRAETKQVHAALSHMGNQAIGGIMLGHDRTAEMAHNVARIANHVTRPRPATGRSPHPDYP